MIEHAAKITAINPSAARFTLEEMFGLVLVGVSILGNVFAARNLHSSLFSFRRPQCFSFDESYSGIGFFGQAGRRNAAQRDEATPAAEIHRPDRTQAWSPQKL